MSKMELKIASFVLLPKGEQIFSEMATTVRIDEEAGGGPFIVIRQDGRCDNNEHTVDVTFAEWALLSEAVERLRAEWGEVKG